jgi:phosphate transport system ATP-binding protein
MSQRPFPLPMSIYDNITFGPRIHRMKRLTSLSRLGEFIKQHDVPGFDVDAALRAAEGRPHGARDLLVEFYLRLASLWDEVRDRLHAPASRLSIGQQQRLALARTLAVEPEAILADEPTSTLLPISAQLIERQFRALKKNYSIIVVTHILRQARRIADYVVFLYLGELIEHGPAEEFFANPQDPRTRAYISGEIS